MGWIINTPGAGDTVPLNPDKTVTVTVDDNLTGNTGYIAAIYDPLAGPPVPAAGGPLPPSGFTLLPNTTGSLFSASVPAPVPPYKLGVVVYPTPLPSASQANLFNIKSGSGSGSGSDDGILTAALPGVQIPRILYAHIAYAGLGNQAVALTYDPNTRSWISDAVCGTGGFRLVSGATTWELVVKGQTKYQAYIAQGGPSVPFQIGFRGVALPIQGGKIANAEVEILLG